MQEAPGDNPAPPALVFPVDRLLCAALCVLLLVACGRPPEQRALTPDPSTAPAQAEPPPRNIILMIGDGMGFAHIAAARIHAHGADGRLALDQLPVVGHITTHSADALVTDSAAAGTALATGLKTDNRRIAMTRDNKALYTILEAARDHGLATGLVVTSAITHATPAVFAAHVPHRRQEADIARQMLEGSVDVMLGGGRRFFLPPSAGGERTDGRNLIEEARRRGYTVVSDSEALARASARRVLGLFAHAAMTTHAPEPTLAQMTTRALELLSAHRKGFFVMIEGSQIDWAGHDNDAEKLLRQMLVFDEAVRAALDFARREGRTLVVVTADHETGGMAILDGALDGGRLELGWNTKRHTAGDAAVYAFGPRAFDFTGVYDNTRIPKLFAGYLGVEDFPRAMALPVPP